MEDFISQQLDAGCLGIINSFWIGFAEQAGRSAFLVITGLFGAAWGFEKASFGWFRKKREEVQKRSLAESRELSGHAGPDDYTNALITFHSTMQNTLRSKSLPRMKRDGDLDRITTEFLGIKSAVNTHLYADSNGLTQVSKYLSDVTNFLEQLWSQTYHSKTTKEQFQKLNTALKNAVAAVRGESFDPDILKEIFEPHTSGYKAVFSRLFGRTLL